MEGLKTSKIASVAAVIFLGLCLSLLFYSQRQNVLLRDSLNNEKLRFEALLSEKLLLEKSILKVKGQVQESQGRVLRLETKNQIAGKELTILQQEIQKRKTQLMLLAKQKEDLTMQILQDQTENKLLSKENEVLRDSLRKAVLLNEGISTVTDYHTRSNLQAHAVR